MGREISAGLGGVSRQHKKKRESGRFEKRACQAKSHNLSGAGRVYKRQVDTRKGMFRV